MKDGTLWIWLEQPWLYNHNSACSQDRACSGVITDNCFVACFEAATARTTCRSLGLRLGCRVEGLLVWHLRAVNL